MSGSWHAREGLRSYVMSFRCYTRKFLTIRHRPRCGVLFAELPLAPSQTTSVCMRRLQWTTNSVEKHAPCGNRLVHVCRSLSPRGEGRHDGQSDALEDKKKDRRETHVSWDKQLPWRPCPPVCIPVLSFLVNFFLFFEHHNSNGVSGWKLCLVTKRVVARSEWEYFNISSFFKQRCQ